MFWVANLRIYDSVLWQTHRLIFYDVYAYAGREDIQSDELVMASDLKCDRISHNIVYPYETE